MLYRFSNYRFKSPRFILAVALTAALASSLGAEESSKGPSAEASDPASARADTWLLAKYDTDGDRVITLDEISQKRERLFGYMDQDENGVVSFSEYQHLDNSKRAELLKARFYKLDRDHNGALSANEYNSYLGSFDRFDSNNDGRVTLREMVPSSQKKTANATGQSNVTCFWRVCFKTD